MASLNLSSDGPSINNSYQKVINSPPPSGPAASSPTYGQWALFTVQAPLVSAFQQDSGKESVLKVQTVGDGELIDLIEDFSEGRIQFAFVKVKDPNTSLPKNVLIAWCGDGVPERTKGYFTSHVNAVAKVLYGYHIQITARSTDDLTPESILQKVADSSGSKYSGGGNVPSAGRTGPAPPVASKPIMPTKSFGGAGGFQALGSRSRAPQSTAPVDGDGWGEDAPPVVRSQLEKVDSAYRPTKVDINQLQSQHQSSRYEAPAPTSSNADVVSGSYNPIGKVDINAIRREAQGQGSMKDNRPTVIKGAYEPIGKVDIAEIRRKAQGGSGPAPAQPPPAATSADDEQPKSLADRSAAFSNNERLTSLPKPAVSNRFGGQASNFAGTRAPVPGSFEAKPNIPSAAPVGMASKNFADQGGKTPAQQWAERKARERGNSGAADTQASMGSGAPASPLQSQTSGGWQSGYAGKKWGVQIPSKTGTSTISNQKTGDEEEPSESYEASAPSGGIGSIRDRFKDAPPMGAARDSFGSAPEPPPLDNASKPNSGVRGVPIPGLPQRTPAQEDIPEEEHHDLPPPPPRPIPQDEQEDEDDYDIPQGSGSPVRIAMPVARGPEPEPLEKPEPLPPRPMPTSSLERAATDNLDPEPEAHVHDDEPARAAGLAAAATTFGAATDSRSAGTSGGRSAVAQYDYEKAEDNELALRENERVSNIDMIDEDWWMGTNEKGESGLFPANYVELLPEGHDSEDHASASAPAAQLPVPAPVPEAEHSVVAPAAGPPGGNAAPSALAQYDYEAAEDNELSFPDGAKITDIVSYSYLVNYYGFVLTTIDRNSRMRIGGSGTTMDAVACSRQITCW